MSARSAVLSNKINAMLERYGVKDVSQFTDHYLVFDFEAILKPLEATKKKAKLEFTHEHIPVSVSVSDSLTKEVRCFVNESPKLLLQEMFGSAKAKRDLIAAYNRNKFSSLRLKVNKRIDRARERYEVHPNKIASAALRSSLIDLDDLDKVCKNIPLLGFNSGSYDMNLIKDELFSALAHCNGCVGICSPGRPKKGAPNGPKLAVSAIKSANGYMCLTAGGFKMLDITSDWIDEGSLPPRSAFDSKLRSPKLTDKEWKRVQWVWGHYEMKTLGELLVWFNDLDVLPFMKAIK
ncbi:Hypothetical protein PHPALM_2821, partial [Phytophthora palmivora]